MLINDSLLRLREYLAGIRMRHAFSFQVAITFLAQIAQLILSIATAAIIARWLGPEGKGAIAIALLVPGMLALLLSGGIGVANVYYAGSQRIELPILVGNSVTFALAASFIGGGIVGVLAWTGWLGRLIPGVSIFLILLAMLGFPFALLGSHLATILQGLQRIVEINIARLIQAGLFLLLTILLVIHLGLGLPGALLASILSVVFYCFQIGWLLYRQGASLLPRWNPGVARSTLSFGLRGYLGNLLQFFNYRLDAFLVNFFLGPGGVGIYTVSVRLAELLWTLPNAVGFVIFPKASNTQPDAMNRFTPRVFYATLALTLLSGAGLALIGRQLISVIYSDIFSPAYLPMLALLPGAVLLGSAKVLTNEIAGRGYPLYNSINAGLALVLTIILDLTLIPIWGVLGASIASSIAYLIIFFTAIYFYRRVSTTQAATITPSRTTNLQ